MTADELTRAVELVAAQGVATAAVERWGAEKQLRQTQEECAELIAAVNRSMRGRPGAAENLLEEAGQVLVMLLQVRAIVGVRDFDEAVRKACEKTKARLDASKAT